MPLILGETIVTLPEHHYTSPLDVSPRDVVTRVPDGVRRSMTGWRRFKLSVISSHTAGQDASMTSHGQNEDDSLLITVPPPRRRDTDRHKAGRIVLNLSSVLGVILSIGIPAVTKDTRDTKVETLSAEVALLRADKEQRQARDLVIASTMATKTDIEKITDKLDRLLERRAP